ncbi:hypothetical protein [Marinobacter sp.]|uniref:hypothetical protein n=1 Tax=Marinobacter sp. TaxID=50741 RepID=UPI0034A3242B
MNKQEHYNALAAEGSAVPMLLCGHCHSTLPRARIFRNEGEHFQGIGCQTIGLCSADDCGAVNCCDEALAQLDDPELLFRVAS